MRTLILGIDNKVLLRDGNFFEYENKSLEFIKNDLKKFINEYPLAIYKKDNYLFLICGDYLSDKIKEKNISFKNIYEFDDEILDFYYNEVLNGYKIEGNKFQVWCFGGINPDNLLELVLSGKKSGTSSLKEIYDYYNIKLPEKDEISIITNSKGIPKAVVKLINVKIIPFNLVNEEHAKSEGEGDLSLKYWKEVHWKFFSSECNKMGIEMQDKMLVVCEKFELIKKLG